MIEKDITSEMTTTPLYDLKDVETHIDQLLYTDHVMVDTTTEYGLGYATALAYLKGYVRKLMQANANIKSKRQ